MASGVIKRKGTNFKTFSVTTTTSPAGTITLTTFPDDFHYMIGIKENSEAGGCYVVTYNYRVYGLFSYNAPHAPVANTSVTLEFYYN